MVERVGDGLLKAATGRRVEVLDQAHRKCGLFDPGDVSSATTAQRLLNLIEDGLLDPRDLQWGQEAVESLGRGIEDHIGVVQLDAAVIAVQAADTRQHLADHRRRVKCLIRHLEMASSVVTSHGRPVAVPWSYGNDHA